jgi:hypothetical protein
MVFVVCASVPGPGQGAENNRKRSLMSGMTCKVANGRGVH